MKIVRKIFIQPLIQYYEALVIKLREFKQRGLNPKQLVKKFDELPEYPGKKQKSWVEGSRYHSQELELTIKSMYRQVMRESAPSDEDLMFIK